MLYINLEAKKFQDHCNPKFVRPLYIILSSAKVSYTIQVFPYLRCSKKNSLQGQNTTSCNVKSNFCTTITLLTQEVSSFFEMKKQQPSDLHSSHFGRGRGMSVQVIESCVIPTNCIFFIELTSNFQGLPNNMLQASISMTSQTILSLYSPM